MNIRTLSYLEGHLVFKQRTDWGLWGKNETFFFGFPLGFNRRLVIPAISRIKSCGERKGTDTGKRNTQKWKRKKIVQEVCSAGLLSSVHAQNTGGWRSAGTWSRLGAHGTCWLSRTAGPLQLQTHVNVQFLTILTPNFHHLWSALPFCIFFTSGVTPHLIHSPACCQGDLIKWKPGPYS